MGSGSDHSSVRQAIVAEARTWLGTPHEHACRVKGAGVDCAMFLAEVFHAVGLVDQVEVEAYPHDWHLHQDEEIYLKVVERYAHQVDRAAPLPGDILLYKFDLAISHGAIVVEWPMIIHSYLKAGVILDDGIRNHVLRRAQVGVWSVL